MPRPPHIYVFVAASPFTASLGLLILHLVDPADFTWGMVATPLAVALILLLLLGVGAGFTYFLMACLERLSR